MIFSSKQNSVAKGLYPKLFKLFLIIKVPEN